MEKKRLKGTTTMHLFDLSIFRLISAIVIRVHPAEDPHVR